MRTELYFKASVLLVLITMLTSFAAGCSTSYYVGEGRMRDFSLVKPVMKADLDPVFEDNGLRIVFRIIDDKAIELGIKNRTDRVMRIFWDNSHFVAIDDPETEIGYREAGLFAGRQASNVWTIDAGDSMDIRTFPAYTAFTNAEGEPDNRPLYTDRDGNGTVEDLVGKRIGMDLVMEVDGNTRLFKFRLIVTPSPPGQV